MKKTAALKFWNEYGKWLYTDSRGISLANPAFLFQKDLEAGKYDSTPEPEYLDMLDGFQELDKIWDGKKTASPDFILRRAILGICETPELYKKLICSLVILSAETNYTAKSLECPQSSTYPPDAETSPYKTPSDIYDLLSDHIYGQEEAKRAASMILYNHRHGIRSNSIFIGPSGCGKSEIWRVLSSVFPEIVIFDGTALSASGWKGDLHWSTIFSSIPKDLRSHAVLVCDEADKIMEPMYTSGGSDHSHTLQNSLLKMMDGDSLVFEHDKTDSSGERTFTVDCSGVSVVLLGSFEHLLEKKTSVPRSLGFGRVDDADRDSTYEGITTEDFINHGHMRREIAGRIDTIVRLQPMTQDDYRNLLDGSMSPVSVLSDTYKRKIDVSDDLKSRLSKEAAESGLGVRLVRSRLKQLIDRQIFEDPDADRLTLDVSEARPP